MSILADGTIRQTIEKQPGHGPYLWAVVWQIRGKTEIRVTVFSFWGEMKTFRDAIQENGHTVVATDLAVDCTRKVHCGE